MHLSNKLPRLVLLVPLFAAGCAGSGGAEPTVFRSDSDAAVKMMTCPDDGKPTCIRRMGSLQECTCTTNTDFRRLHKESLGMSRGRRSSKDDF